MAHPSQKDDRGPVRVAWLEWLQAEIMKLSGEDSVELDDVVEQGENFVGTLDIGLRRLYFLSQLLLQQALRAQADAVTLRGEAKLAKLREANHFSSQSRLILGNFWESCKHQFPVLMDKDFIGIRKGWKIVWQSADEDGNAIPSETSGGPSADEDGDSDAGPKKGSGSSPPRRRLH